MNSIRSFFILAILAFLIGILTEILAGAAEIVIGSITLTKAVIIFSFLLLILVLVSRLQYHYESSQNANEAKKFNEILELKAQIETSRVTRRRIKETRIRTPYHVRLWNHHGKSIENNVIALNEKGEDVHLSPLDTEPAPPVGFLGRVIGSVGLYRILSIIFIIGFLSSFFTRELYLIEDLTPTPIAITPTGEASISTSRTPPPITNSTPTLTATPTLTPTLTSTPTPTSTRSLVSEWEINFDWECRGTTFRGIVYFWEDGTLTTEESENGYWTITDNRWEIVVSNRIRYTGELNAEQNNVNGHIYTIINSDLKRGCFTATLLKGVALPTPTSGG